MALSAAPPSGPPLSKRLRNGLLSHVGLLLIVMFGMLGAGVYLTNRVISALPEVGKDLPIANTWGAPIAVERGPNGWLVAHVPPVRARRRARAGPVGRPQPAAVGAQRPGVSDQRLPGRGKFAARPEGGAQVRSSRPAIRSSGSGMFRPTGRPAGVTFRIRDLRAGKVRYGGKWMTADQFKGRPSAPRWRPPSGRRRRLRRNTLPANASAATQPRRPIRRRRALPSGSWLRPGCARVP